ncbi:E3 ubiquitin-protein ligase UBR1 [Thelohanellus kitauei]|uniref:E3 ubiquitin-protein ligase n=1 Tax=Thelohanellus kitauei TaxID=669202 RepID=A0A0C2N497_THEKT|nr:E3 ubiquitin-protein ligase UBR1 [Thelohanellus kitauei]
MITEHSLEQIDSCIDTIMTRALLMTSDNPESDPQKIYDSLQLHKLVITSIYDLLFEKFDTSTRNRFFSKDDALGRCMKLLTPSDIVYMCNDCSPNIFCPFCEECFKNSIHFKHNCYTASVNHNMFCHCGDSKSNKKSVRCGNHQIPKISRNLPEQFIKRIRYVIRSLFRYLELLCGDESSLNTYVEGRLLMSDDLEKLDPENNPKGIFSYFMSRRNTTNCQKWCVLIFRPEDESREYADSCVSFINPPGILANLQSNFESCGYLCVKYRDTLKNCQANSVKIQNFIEDLPRSGLHCRLVKVYRLFFMKLSSVLIHFIKESCLRRSELCDLISGIVFQETTLAEMFFFNRSLWNDIRYNLTFRIFMPTLFSRKGALYLSEFYFQVFERLYSELLVNNDLRRYVFCIALQFVKSKTQLIYLVENGILCKILDFISDNFKEYGFGVGVSISKILKQVGPRKWNTIYVASSDLKKLLCFAVNFIDPSDQIEPELQKTSIRLVQFCADFDDMESITLIDTSQEDGISPKDVHAVIGPLNYILIPYIMIILKFDDVANKILRELVRVFKKDMKRIIANLSTQRAIETLITHPNIGNKPFSIYNLSQRLFCNILARCLASHKLSEELKRTIFDDQVLLMWISQIAIASLSLEMKFKSGHLIDHCDYLSSMVSMYHGPLMIFYLFLLDFNTVQFLISSISPEHFLKYLLFNVCPSIRGKATVSQSLESILALPEFEDTLVVQQIFILIYNAITELRLNGDLKDSYYYLIERQHIRRLAFQCKIENIFINTILTDFAILNTSDPYSNTINIDEVLFNISSSLTPSQTGETQSIFPKYLNPGTPFHCLCTTEETKNIFQTLLCRYKNQVPNFLLPDVTSLKEDFKGMDNFLFSQTFLNFNIECFVKWYRNPELWKRDSPDIFLFILLCLCWILRVSKDRSICESYRERMFDFFGPQPKLENRSFMDIIENERPNSENPLVASMIDRFIDLSHIGQRNITNI